MTLAVIALLNQVWLVAFFYTGHEVADCLVVLPDKLILLFVSFTHLLLLII